MQYICVGVCDMEIRSNISINHVPVIASIKRKNVDLLREEKQF